MSAPQDLQRPPLGRAISRWVVLTAAVVLIAQIAISAWAWGRIPADALVPTHWGLDGQPNGWSTKQFALGFGPGLTVVLAVLFLLLPRIEPRRANLARSSVAYGWVVGAVIVLLGGLHVVVVLAALGSPIAIGRVVTVGVGVLFAVIGLALRRINSNFMFGIRTPWTLTSELSWRRTHLITGWLWAGLGVALMLLATLGVSDATLFAFLFSGLGVTLVFSFAYSYFVWSKDPDRSR